MLLHLFSELCSVIPYLLYTLLTTIYQTLLDILQHPQGEERKNKPTVTVATQTLVTGTATTPAPATDTVGTQTPVRGAAAEPERLTRSLSLSELRDVRKDFSRHPGEHLVTWLLRCWSLYAHVFLGV